MKNSNVIIHAEKDGVKIVSFENDQPGVFVSGEKLKKLFMQQSLYANALRPR